MPDTPIPDPLTRSEIQRVVGGSNDTTPSDRITRPAVPVEVTSAPPVMRLGKFVRTHKLGSGGMGEVWKAYDTDLGRWVALKILKSTDEDEVLRFAREAQIAGRLSHPYIASIYEVGEADGRRFIAMQFIDGVTLRVLPRGDGTRLVRLVRDAARAVAFAHSQGVIHRDIKPENLMVRQHAKDLHLYVMDFGLARTVEARDLSLTGSVVGTPAYMPPEQARGERVDERADVYSLGATLYELLSGRPPFKGNNVYEVLRAVLELDPPPLQRVAPDLINVVNKCLDKERERRYPSAAALADDLDRWLANEPVLARPPSAGYRFSKWFAKRKFVVIPTAVALILGVGGTIWMVTAAAGRTRDFDASMKSGRDAELRGDLPGAQEAFQRAAILRPGEADDALARVRAEIARRRDETDAKAQALKDLEAARLDVEQATRLLYSRDATVSEIMRRAEQARSHIDEALKRSPKLAQAHHLLGLAQELMGNPGAAEEAWRKAVELDPLFAAARLRLAQRLLERAYVARLYFAHDDQNVKEREAVRLASEAGAQLEAAMQVIDNPLQRELATAMERYAKADITGLRAIAKSAADALGDRPGAEEAHWLAGLAAPTPAEARDAFDRALAIRPKNTMVLYSRAYTRRDLNDLDGAIADLSEAIRLQPRFTPAWMQRGSLQMARGDFPAAERDYERAIELEPENAGTHLNRGLVRMRRGRWPQAAADLRESIRLQETALAFFGLGSCLQQLGDEPAAVRAWSDAIRVDPDFLDSYVNRGNARMRQRDFVGAAADYTEVLRRKPDDLEVRLYRASMRAQGGDKSGALEDFEECLRRAPDGWQYRENVERTIRQLREE